MWCKHELYLRAMKINGRLMEKINAFPVCWPVISSSEISNLPSNLSFLAKYLFLRQFLSHRHYQPTNQSTEKVYWLISLFREVFLAWSTSISCEIIYLIKLQRKKCASNLFLLSQLQMFSVVHYLPCAGEHRGTSQSNRTPTG